MLDEIYTEQFDKHVEPIFKARQEEQALLRLKVVESESRTPKVKDAIDKIIAAKEAFDGIEKYLERRGMRLSSEPRVAWLEINGYGDVRHPALQAHVEETRKIEVDLAKKKKEIRARVYGMDTTYAEVEREVARELASILK